MHSIHPPKGSNIEGQATIKLSPSVSADNRQEHNTGLLHHALKARKFNHLVREMLKIFTLPNGNTLYLGISDYPP